MLYKKRHSVPYNTKIGDPDWQKLDISKGTIIEWIIVTPLECANLLQFWVEFHGVQLLPFSTGERIYGFTTNAPIKESIEIKAPPYELDIYAINTDTAKAHEYNIYVNVMPKKPIKPEPPISQRIVEAFQGMFGGD